MTETVAAIPAPAPTTTLLFNATDRAIMGSIRGLKPSQLVVLMDTNTKKHCWPVFERIAKRFTNVLQIVIKPGELHKNFESVQYICDQLLKANADRDTVLVNLGGGVITDLGGFAASIYKRGIKYVNIPTTLLAQADAAIGGKTAINTGIVKNAVGTFYPPALININTTYLDTLADKEGLNGLAEVMKHALLDGEEHWTLFKKFLDEDIDLVELLKKSVEFKLKVVESDPLEKGYRQILNFGHTVGHAIEAYMLSMEKPVRHGYAVAYGMDVALTLSELQFGVKSPTFKEAKDVLHRLYPNLDINIDEVAPMLVPMQNDKKIKNSKICFVLLDGIGKPHFDCMISYKDIEAAVNQLVRERKAA